MNGTYEATMKPIMIHAAYLLFGSLLMIAVSRAGSYGIAGTITAIGCQTVNGICFVTLSGAAAGPPGCVQSNVRWDSANTPNGKEAVAQLTAAYLAGKQVTISVADNCFAEFPSYPTMDYYIISD
jgi:hypothetical protein